MVDACAQPLTRRQVLRCGCMTFAGALLAMRRDGGAQTQTIRVGTFRQNHVVCTPVLAKVRTAGGQRLP